MTRFHRVIDRLDRRLTRFSNLVALPLAGMYLVLAFIYATQADYITVLANAVMCLVFFAYHVAKLDLDDDGRYRFAGVDYGMEGDHTAIIHGYRLRDGSIVITSISTIATK